MAGEHLVERRRELAVAIADQEPEPGGAFAEVHEQVTGLLSGPRTRGTGGDAQDVHAAGLALHHDQDVQAMRNTVSTWKKPDAGPGGLGGQELPPGR